MPADDTYSVVHPLTVAADRYGCWNRDRFKASLQVQDGWRSNGTRNTKIVPFTLSRDCMHDKKRSDPRCHGCDWTYINDSDL